MHASGRYKMRVGLFKSNLVTFQCEIFSSRIIYVIDATGVNVKTSGNENSGYCKLS